MAHRVVESVRRAGVVGGGGAGFPTHVKLDAQVDTFLVNAAECEPLLCKDQELMVHHAARMVDGLRLAMEATGAGRGIIAIKRKYKGAIAALEEFMTPGMSFYLFENFYPAGDEVVVVYDATGRLIPAGGLPLHVGCAVSNVETLINVSLACEGVPVTHTALTVAGAVKKPISAVVPIGVTIRQVLELAGGATVAEPAVLDGGAMMGNPVLDLDTHITKTTGGFIVLAKDHKLIVRKTLRDEAKVRIARSACDQCSHCTEFCPRYLLGYGIEPHKVMRSVGFQGDQELAWAIQGLQCCECGVCDLYACPEDLTPRDMCIRSKQLFRQQNRKPDLLPGRGEAHPMREGRRIPIPRLTHRLGLTEWDVHAPMTDEDLHVSQVRLMLSQHIGAPAAPVVREGQIVAEGELVARIPDGKLGANVHASIAGRVSHIDDKSIWVEKQS